MGSWVDLVRAELHNFSFSISEFSQNQRELELFAGYEMIVFRQLKQTAIHMKTPIRVGFIFAAFSFFIEAFSKTKEERM